jgi:hypothetical protein
MDSSPTMPPFQNLFEFLYYVEQLCALVELVLGVPLVPSSSLEKVNYTTEVAPYVVPQPINDTYYSMFTLCLTSMKQHLVTVLDEQIPNLSQEQREVREQSIMDIYQPMVKYVLDIMKKELDVKKQFEYFYADLLEYNTQYAAQYDKNINQLVAALTQLKETREEYYYDVIHEYSIQEQFGIHRGLEHNPYLNAFRHVLDDTTSTYHDFVQAYLECMSHFHNRPTHLKYQWYDIYRLERQILSTKKE